MVLIVRRTRLSTVRSAGVQVLYLYKYNGKGAPCTTVPETVRGDLQSCTIILEIVNESYNKLDSLNVL